MITPYNEIQIRLFMFFSKPEHLEAALDSSNLPDEEKAAIRKCLTRCTVNGTEYHVLFTGRKPGRYVPNGFAQHARAIYENYPNETHYNVRKNSTSQDMSAALDDFGWDLPVYNERLFAFSL